MATKAEDPAALAATAAVSDSLGDLPALRSAAVESFDPAEPLDKRKGKCGGGDKHRDGGDNDEEEEESREKKRRRTNRQLSLEKPPPSSTAQGSGDRANGSADFSFSFDTRISTPIETTPKFGSFNFSLDLAEFAASNNNEKEEKEDDKDELESGTQVEGIVDGEGKIVI